MMLFPMSLFLAKIFPKIVTSIFSLNFHGKCSQNFPAICIFRPNARKISTGFVKLCEIG